MLQEKKIDLMNSSYCGAGKVPIDSSSLASWLEDSLKFWGVTWKYFATLKQWIGEQMRQNQVLIWAAKTEFQVSVDSREISCSN